MKVFTLTCRRLNNKLERRSLYNQLKNFDVITMPARDILNGEQIRRMEERMESIFFFTIHFARKVKDKY